MGSLATNLNSGRRGVLILAYGSPRYVEQARALAHSMHLYAPHVSRTLVTDSHEPSILKLFDKVIAYRPEFGSGVSQKLFLDHYSPYEETLFIDSDSLVLGNLDSFWTAFAGQTFGVPGFRYLERGDVDPFLDVDHALDTLHVTRLPKFNGGTYYFARSPQTTDFFNTVRTLLDRWSSLRVTEFRRKGPADEAIYSLAMAVHNIAPTSMGTGGMWTPIGSEGTLRLDVLRGTCSFLKEGVMVSPEVVHFPGNDDYSYAYARERAKLRKKFEGRSLPMWTLAGSYTKSALWQSYRSSAGFSRVARACVRAYRRANNSSSGNGAALKSGLRQ